MLAYFKLLLRERLMAFLPGRNQKTGQSRTKVIWGMIGLGAVFLMVYATIVALEYLMFQGFVMIGNPAGMLAMLFLLCILFTLFISFFDVFHTLFFSKDILFVSALPISSRGLFGAKLGLAMAGEAAIALLICLPAMILYGVHTGAGAVFYLKTVLFVPFLPVVPVAMVAVAAFFLIRVSALWKRREGVTTVVTFGVMVGIVVGQMALSGYLGEQASREMLMAFLLRRFDVVELVAVFFPPIRWICAVFLSAGAESWFYGLLLILLSRDGNK